MVSDKWLMVNGRSVTLDLTDVSKGIYFIEMKTGSSTGSVGSLTTNSPTEVLTKKIIKQ